VSVEERRHESPRIINDRTGLRELFFEDLRIFVIEQCMEKAAMTKLTILSAVAVLSIAATPASAQSTQFAQQEPAAVASIYPNAGVHSPAHSLAAMAFLPPGKSHAKPHVKHR
jgi:hypothetical protein